MSEGEAEGSIDRSAGRAEPTPVQRDTAFLEWLLPLMKTFGRYFGSEVRGFDRLPESGPMLLVGNHSGGTIVPDTAVLISAWYEERGIDDALVGLAFDSMFEIPGVGSLMWKIGEIPASHDNALEAFAQGASVLVYPGGAHEAFRPWTARNQIDFGGHRGFVKLALREGVPVIPVVAHGGHNTTVVLTRGDAIARRLGFERRRVPVSPIVWQVPWGVSLPILPGIPLPAKITVELGEPIDWSHYGPEAADDEAVVDRCYAQVTGRMQATLDALVAERPYPVLSRLRDLGFPLPDFSRQPD